MRKAFVKLSFVSMCGAAVLHLFAFKIDCYLALHELMKFLSCVNIAVYYLSRESSVADVTLEGPLLGV